MKKILLFSLLAMIFTVGITNDAHAQRYGKKKKKSSKVDEYFNESGNFASKLWYGGFFNLGFSGSGEYNAFVFGLSPMVGYKFFDDRASVGPRFGFTYTFIKGRATDNTIKKVKPFSWTISAFGRIKIIDAFFAHFEYENEHTENVIVNGPFLALDPNDVTQVWTTKEIRDNAYVGAGYNSSAGLWGYEIVVLYNLNAPDNTIDLPFSFRFGITYNF